MNDSDFDKWDDVDEEWRMQLNLGIDEVRALYDHFCYSIEMWPGAPRRPYYEQELLAIMKARFFAMLQEYNYYNN